MADKFYRVAKLCEWCGHDVHEPVDDDHPHNPIPIFNDYDGRQYCSIYCSIMGYAFYNGTQPEKYECQDLLAGWR